MATLEGAKPCPFCGNDVINLDVIDGEVTPWCTNCSAQGPSKHFGPDGTAAGAWNDTRLCESDDLDAMRTRAEAAEARAALAEAVGYRRAVDDACAALDAAANELMAGGLPEWGGYTRGRLDGLRDVERDVRRLAPV